MAGLLVGLRVDREPVGVAAVGDEALGAVDDVLVALADGGRAHAGDVGAGVGLGQAEGGELVVLGQHPEVLLLELLGAGEGERRGGEAVGADRGGDAGAAPGELLLDDRALEVAEAGPAVLLGRVAVHEAELPGLAEHVLGPRAVAVVLPGDGTDLLLGEVVRHLAQRLLLVGKREVHHGFSSQIDWSVNSYGKGTYPDRPNKNEPLCLADGRQCRPHAGGIRDRALRGGGRRLVVAVWALATSGGSYDQIGRGGMALDRRRVDARRARGRDPPDARGPQRAPRGARRGAAGRRRRATRADGADDPELREEVRTLVEATQRAPRRRAARSRSTSRPRSTGACASSADYIPAHESAPGGHGGCCDGARDDRCRPPRRRRRPGPC